MKISKIFLMAGLAMMTFVATSCSSKDDWAPGEPTTSGGQNVYLDTEESIALPLDGNTFEVTFKRTATSGDLTIPVNFSTPTPEIFTDVPSTVTFASGAAEAKITITCKSDMEVFHTYRATITIDQQYTTQYADAETNCPKAELNVIKEDYKPLQEKVSAVQENSLDFFSTPAKIVVGINEISYTVENDKCEMTGFFNHDLQLVRVTQKDKAVAKGMAIFVSLFICLSLTLILYWAILAIIFAIGLLVITIHKIFQKRKTVVC